MEELTLRTNQIAEITTLSGNAIGNSLTNMWIKCKKHMSWHQILRVEIKSFFDSVLIKILSKTKYRIK